MRRRDAGVRIVMIDPQEVPGRGLAYGTPCRSHLLNVAAGGMSADPERAGHFLDWWRGVEGKGLGAGDFAPRMVFGGYVQALFGEAGVEHVRDRAVGYRREGGVGVVSLAGGGEVRAGDVVLATGNFTPCALPGEGYRQAWDDAFYEAVRPEESVVLVGTGLTMVDVVLRLRDRGHRGRISAVSRNGFLPEVHAPCEKADMCSVPLGTEPTALAYVRAFRWALGRHGDWRAAVDVLRPVENALWAALPVEEKARFRRHLQRRWDIVRHRIAPQVAEGLRGEAYRLKVVRGRVERTEREGDGFVVHVRVREGVEHVEAAHVVMCTGPDMDYRRVGSALLNGLIAEGVAGTGLFGAGLALREDGAVLDREGLVSEGLYALGPARQGVLFESIAIPEIRRQAADLAVILAAGEEEGSVG